MPAFFDQVDVSAAAAYPTNPQIVVPFVPDSILFYSSNLAEDGVVSISYDGKTEHGRVTAGRATESIAVRTKVTQVWLKRISGTNPTTIEVTASTDV